MSINPKIKRKWVKEEKRIVYLLYRKGFLKDFKITDFYWAEYNWLGRRCRKSKKHNFRFPIYMPEIHYCTTDYWGESDEHSIVSHILNMLYWNHIDTSGEYLKSSFKVKKRSEFIKYLKSLPTIISDKKINKVLKKVTLWE